MNNNGTMISNVPAQEEGLLMKNGVPTIVAAGETDATDAYSAGVNVMSGDEKLHTISILVENRAGILARVSHVFARRGFNIESLAVSRTEDPTVSRMTVVVAGNDEVFEQMGKQLLKLIDVIKVIDHTRDNMVQREMALVKVRTPDAATRAEVTAISGIFRTGVVDVSPDTLMIEVTGKEDKIDAFVKMLAPFEILELVRTGRIVLVRGPKQT